MRNATFENSTLIPILLTFETAPSFAQKALNSAQTGGCRLKIVGFPNL